MDTLAARTARRASALKRLARALDVPVEKFLDGSPDNVTSDILALVNLWLAIEDSQGRHRVLSVAQREVERSGYKGSD